MLTASVVTSLVNELHRLPGGVVYLVVTLLVFGEAALFLGFVLPGETTVLVAGVLASQGVLNLGLLMVIVVAAAVVGDTVGYVVGRRYGQRLLSTKLLQRHRGALDDALEGLRRRGATYVFLGRFTAFLRAVMPGLAGMSSLNYRRFLVANVASAAVWGVGFSLAGYLAGTQLHRLETDASWFTSLVLALALVAVGAWWWRRRRARA